METLRTLAAEEGVVAMGETGLDYFYTPETKAQQQTSFRDHIRIGRELNKPVIVHTRDARADTTPFYVKKGDGLRRRTTLFH